MKISYNWLKEYVDFVLTPRDVAEVLTGVGLEVESVEKYESVKGGLEGVVIGEVLECSKHPDADKLTVTKVNIGQSEPLQIVCGAPNVAVGQKVAVATVGSTIHPISGEPITMRKAKIRGVESYGMICAEDELGIGSSHDGIMVLDASATPGTKASEYFNVTDDYVLDIGLTPNRADANSHIGVARDLAAALNVAYKSPVTFSKPDVRIDTKQTEEACPFEIIIRDTVACPRYSGLYIKGLHVKPSPDWLKNRLQAIGVRSVNAIVDVTNYVLHEFGQPLHAFDASKISGRQVIVGKQTDGTKFTTLDGNELKLSAEDLTIQDAEGPMCIAGVYGGFRTGISDSTTEVFLESAHFSATSVRKTAHRHQLRTDAATHFEKGCDPNITLVALQRAALLITEICGGSISQINDVYPVPVQPCTLQVSYKRLITLAGFDIPQQTVKSILQHLEIAVDEKQDGSWQLTVPTFKNEVTREADILEEVLRIYGYNSFTLPTSLRSNVQLSPAVVPYEAENKIADYLSGFGLHEIWTNSVTQSRFERKEEEHARIIKLLNSQTTELDSLRHTMLYSGLEVIARNQKYKQGNLALFEFGTTYHHTDGQYIQQKHVSIWLSGSATTENWLEKVRPYDFYYIKTLVNNVLQKLGIHLTEKEITTNSLFAYGIAGYAEETISVVEYGMVQPATLKAMDVSGDVWYAVFNWDYLMDKCRFVKVRYQELPKYPTVVRDLAMVLKEETRFETAQEIVKTECRKWFKEVTLFDVYRGEKIGEGQKSYAISITLQHPEKTLTEADIEKVMGKVMNRLETDLGAVIRKK